MENKSLPDVANDGNLGDISFIIFFEGHFKNNFVYVKEVRGEEEEKKFIKEYIKPQEFQYFVAVKKRGNGFDPEDQTIKRFKLRETGFFGKMSRWQICLVLMIIGLVTYIIKTHR